MCKNRFSILDEDSDNSDDEMVKPTKSIKSIKSTKSTKSTKSNVSSDFVKSKLIKKITKKNLKKNVDEKQHPHSKPNPPNKMDCLPKTRFFRVNERQRAQNELDKIPDSIVEAINKKQNLTLKQILVLMNLHAIPNMVLNMIHDKLQTKIKRNQVKIYHDSRIFYVSQYNWYDLNRIESMINEMFES